jgi:hypothetical protein
LLPERSPDRFRALATVGKATDDIVRVAREQKAELIVMGTHGWGAVRHLLGSRVVEGEPQGVRPRHTVDATPGELRLHSGSLGVPSRRSDNGSASFNRDEVCDGSKKTNPASVLATAHTKEA